MKNEYLLRSLVVAFFSIFLQSAFSQTPQGCNPAAIRAAFAASGNYTELPVTGQGCSMYFIDNRSLDAAQAETDANTLGAHLVVMNDATENTNVFNALTAGGYLAGNARVWLGYKRTATASPTFYALDGSTGNFLPPTSSGGPTPGIYQNWDAGEPNNNGYQCAPGCFIGCNVYECNNGEQCVQVRSNALWNDLPCNDTSKSVIEVNLCPELTSSNDTLICSGGGATLKAKAILGSNPITFTWNPGGLTGSLQTVFPAAPVAYIVQATDRYGCYQQDTVNITINPNCNVPAGPKGCNIAAVRAAFAASGGRYVELPVTGQSCSMYFVDNNTMDAAQAESDANLLGAHLTVFNDAAENTNVVAALNAGGYLANGDPVWIGIKRVSNGNSQFYALDGSTGNFTPGPPSATVFQNWAAGEPNNSKPGCCNTPILGNTCVSSSDRYKCSNGEQCVQIYSGGQWNDLSCDRTSKSVIEVNLCPELRATRDTTICSSSSLNITTNTILGSQPYIFAWTPGGQSTASIAVTPPVGTTKYIARATDRYGCYGEDTTEVISISTPAPTITSSPTPAAVCTNQKIDLTYAGNYSTSAVANWSLAGGVAQGSLTNNPLGVVWTTAGPKNVALFITDGRCTSPTTNFSVTVNPSPIANAGPDILACSGQNYNLGVAPVGGAAYTWNNTVGLSSTSISDPVFNYVNPLSTTQVSAFQLVASENGCVGVDTVIVTLYPAIDNSFTFSKPSVCIGENDTIRYTGTNPASATYTWDFDGGTVVSGTGQGPYVVNWATPSVKNVSLSVNANGCSVPANVQTVGVGTPPTVDAGPDQTVCSGGTIQIGSPAITGFTYSWDDGSNLDDSTSSSPFFSFPNFNPTPEVITLTTTANQNGCTASDQVVITVSPPDPTTIVANGNTTFCDGDFVELESTDANLIALFWSTQETDPIIRVDSSGTFGLIGIDAQGCLYVSNAITTTMVSNPVIALAPNGIINETCSNYKDGSITVAVSSGTPSYQYKWSTTPVQTTATASNIGANPYTVIVSDANNCTATATYTVQAAVVFDLTIDSTFDASCYGFSNGRIFTSPLGGNSPYRYIWSNNKTTRAIGGLTAGVYSVTARDGNNCSTTKSITLSQPAEIITSTGPEIKINFLETATIDLSVLPSANYNYIWSPAATLSCVDCEDPDASPVRTTTYTVIVIDQTTGCKDTTKVKVSVDATKNLYIPNAFTPNGDVRNEEWKVFSKGVKFFEATVYNKWGEKVFQTNDINIGWDGTFKGAPVSLGIYPYQVRVTFLDNEVIDNKGTISILR